MGRGRGTGERAWEMEEGEGRGGKGRGGGGKSGGEMEGQEKRTVH